MSTSSRFRTWVYYHLSFVGHALNTAQDLGVKIATQTGILFGQLIFGFLADVYGRRKMCMSLQSEKYPFHSHFSSCSSDGIELVVIVFATLAQALSGAAPAVGIIGSLVVWRFVVRRLVCIGI